jgi:hypothetical protein
LIYKKVGFDTAKNVGDKRSANDTSKFITDIKNIIGIR